MPSCSAAASYWWPTEPAGTSEPPSARAGPRAAQPRSRASRSDSSTLDSLAATAATNASPSMDTSCTGDIAITADTSAPRLLMATSKGSYATPIPGGGVTDRIFADGFDGP